jgi:hypothetical protein
VLARNNRAHPRTPHHTRLRAHPHQSQSASPDDQPILSPLHAKVIFGYKRSSCIYDRLLILLAGLFG